MRVLICGSCRVGKPIRAEAPEEWDVIDIARVLTFSHTAPEALQQIRMLRGEIPQPPEWLREYLTARLPWVARMPIPPPDVAVVEICTRKLYTVDGWLVPHRSLGALEDASIRWDTHAMTDDEVRASVLELAAYLAPARVMLVAHVDIVYPGIGRIPGRGDLIRVLAGMHLPIVIPGPLIERWGDGAMIDESHYSPDAERYMGRVLVGRCARLARHAPLRR